MKTIMEERTELYKELIFKLINCQNGQKVEILLANAELIDLGLVFIMNQTAQYSAENNNQNIANFLQKISTQLVQVMGFDSFEKMYQDYQKCVLEILSAVHENAEPQIIYSLLNSKINKLDYNFAVVLFSWAQHTFAQVSSEEATVIAADIGIFSNLIGDFPLGNIVINKELETLSMQLILSVFTKSKFPQDWAMIQHNLGNTYQERIKGDKGDNLELAIQYHQNVLQIRTKSKFPQQWANTQYNLGNAYIERIKGDKADNLELAIQCHQNALQIRTKSQFPQDWAMTQNNLGVAYMERIKGDKEDSLELAIQYHQNALQIHTKTDFPQDWAITQNNLGVAYIKRIKGDKEDNLELAIQYHQNALQIYAKSKFPQDWAMIQHNLGNTYIKRIKGDKGDNLELAIQYYQNALQIRTKSQFPQQWANTQHGLGIAYSNRIKGDKAENLEKAINCYQNALTIRTPEAFTLDHLQTSRNLGNLYFTQGNWQSAMETYCSGIEAIEILRNSGRNDQRRQEILSESMDIYEKMIQACVNVGNIPLAIETSERSRGRYLAELMASKDLYPNAEIPSEVLNYLEQLEELEDRLAELRNSQASDNTRSLESVGARRDSQDLITVITEEFNQLKAKKEELRLKIREFDPFLAGQKSVEAIPFDRIQALIDNDQTAILTFHSTSEATYAFIIYKDCPPKVHHYPNQGKSQLHRECLWDNWLTPYLTDFKGWNSNISTVLQQLSQCLEIDQLIDNYLQNIEELIIIPHFLLHQIPFAALPIKEVGSRKSEVGSVKEVRRMKSESESFGEVRGMGGSFKTTKTETIENVTYLSDKFRLRILPSCQILNYCHSRQPLENKTEMGLIENASEDLPYTTYECQQLAQKYNIKSNYRLTGQKATVQECRQLLDKVQIIHFSHHGSANPNNPLESSLILSDRNLTLGEILNWRLPNLSDVFLNNCETNFSVNKITDDLLTLSSGWLCIGARGVISTLWAVDDCASALFSLFYYEYRDAGLTRSQSLQQAQQTLRNLTGEKLKRDYSGQLEQHLHNLYQGTFRILETARFKDSETYQTYQKRLEKIDYQIKYTLPHHYRAKYPFKSPYYWAGFIAQGLA